jgi:hypothetical protein
MQSVQCYLSLATHERFYISIAPKKCFVYCIAKSKGIMAMERALLLILMFHGKIIENYCVLKSIEEIASLHNVQASYIFIKLVLMLEIVLASHVTFTKLHDQTLSRVPRSGCLYILNFNNSCHHIGL